MIRTVVLVILAALLCASAATANPYVPLASHGPAWVWVVGILFGETLLLWLLVIDLGFRGRFLVLMFATNAATWTVFYLLSIAIRGLRLPEASSVAILEGAIALVEATVLFQLAQSGRVRRQDGRRLSWPRALLSSGIANAASLSFGFIAFWKSQGVLWNLIPR